MTTLKTTKEKLEYKTTEGKKLVLEINTGDAEKVSAWFKVIETSKKEFAGSDYIGAKAACKKIVASILSEKTFDKIVKVCNNNLSCILIIVLDIVERVSRAQYQFKEEIEERAEALKTLGK